MYRVAHNRAMSHLASRAPAAADLAHAASVVDQRPSPEAVASASQQREALFAALHRLAVGQRQILTMALDGLTTREIADVLGILGWRYPTAPMLLWGASLVVFTLALLFFLV